MIKYLTDTDFYIFTMMQAVFHRYTNVNTRFEFKWRNWDKMKLNIPLIGFVDHLKERLGQLCELKFTQEELAFLSDIPFFKPDFIEYLRLFRLNRNYIHPYIRDDCLQIEINGPLLNVICFEVPVLAIISQLYTENRGEYKINWLNEGRRRLQEKIAYLDSSLHRDMKFQFADFGTRRRSDFEWHNEIIQTLKAECPERFVGTSNVYLAMKHNVGYIGTMAHSWFQVHQQLGPRLIDSQSAALQAWADEYRGELGIALSDTLGFDVFLKDFDRYFALLFDGCRHDSGNPVSWCEKLIAHYQSLRIDSKTKTAVFSDGLTFQVAVNLFLRFHNQINTSFGIGTHLTNDCGYLAPQIVIKNTMCNDRPTAKISDSPGKSMWNDKDFFEYLRKVIKEKIA